MVYKHAYLNILLLLHSTLLCVVKMPLKGAVGGRALNSPGNYIFDHGKSRKNHGIVFLNFCGNPAIYFLLLLYTNKEGNSKQSVGSHLEQLESFYPLNRGPSSAFIYIND